MTTLIGFGQYEWKSYKEIHDMSDGLARYLLANGLCPKNHFEEGDFRMVALYAKNREEWVVTDLGCALTGIVNVTLYDTYGVDSIEYILNQTHIKTVIC